MSIANITGLVHQMLVEDRGSAKRIAEKIGKPYPTLMRELNPWDGGAKLGAETLLLIMQETNNTAPLEYMAQCFGFKLQKH